VDPYQRPRTGKGEHWNGAEVDQFESLDLVVVAAVSTVAASESIKHSALHRAVSNRFFVNEVFVVAAVLLPPSSRRFRSSILSHVTSQRLAAIDARN
jgi:hypothetical protein